MCLVVHWKKVFNLDKMLEWNISSQVEEIKMRVTFFWRCCAAFKSMVATKWYCALTCENCAKLYPLAWENIMCSFFTFFFSFFLFAVVSRTNSNLRCSLCGRIWISFWFLLLISLRPESGISKFTHRLSLKERGAKAEKTSLDRPLSYRRRSLSVDW